jgi:hypothetical protein
MNARTALKISQPVLNSQTVIVGTLRAAGSGEKSLGSGAFLYRISTLFVEAEQAASWTQIVHSAHVSVPSSLHLFYNSEPFPIRRPPTLFPEL